MAGMLSNNAGRTFKARMAIQDQLFVTLQNGMKGAAGMKKYFVVSLVKNGILGGGIVADAEAITYHTGKVTVPTEYKKLVMKYEEISEVRKGWLFILPTVLVKMKNGNEYRFVVFFSRKRLINVIGKRGVSQ